MAAEDGCAPRMTSVRIPSHSDPYILYWPSCTQVPQCGGCCGHDSLECQPKRRQDHSVLVCHTSIYMRIDGTAKTKLAKLAFLHCQEFVKTLFAIFIFKFELSKTGLLRKPFTAQLCMMFYYQL